MLTRAPASPPAAPLLARLLAKAGPARPARLRRAGADVLVVPGRYSVSYVVLGAELIGIVDVGSHADHDRIRAAIEGAGRSLAEVGWVMPSHLHFDHAMGIDALARSLGARVALGRVAYAAVVEGRALRFPHLAWLCRAAPTWPMQGMPLPSLDDLRHGLEFGFPRARNRFRAGLLGPIADGATLPGLPGWTLLEGPGHADDAVLLYHRGAGVLVAGDTVRNFYGGEWNQLVCDRGDYARTRALLGALDVDTVLPGHGPVIEGPRAIARLRTLPPYAP